MPMTMEGSFTAPADKATVWAKLNDPEVLKSCISGCQTLEKTSDTTFVATAKMKMIGKISGLIVGRNLMARVVMIDEEWSNSRNQRVIGFRGIFTRAED